MTSVGADEGITLVKNFIETNSETGYSFDNEYVFLASLAPSVSRSVDGNLTRVNIWLLSLGALIRQ